jgi:hypothetical protein
MQQPIAVFDSDTINRKDAKAQRFPKKIHYKNQ